MSFDYELVFNPDTPETLEAKKKAVQETALAVKAVGDGARACINTEVFQSYKRSFEVAEEKLIKAMIEYTHNFFQENTGDMSLYGANMARFVTKIQDLRALLTAVENDAQKGKQ